VFAQIDRNLYCINIFQIGFHDKFPKTILSCVVRGYCLFERILRFINDLAQKKPGWHEQADLWPDQSRHTQLETALQDALRHQNTLSMPERSCQGLSKTSTKMQNEQPPAVKIMV
jgi:hypothetical protein